MKENQRNWKKAFFILLVISILVLGFMTFSTTSNENCYSFLYEKNMTENKSDFSNIQQEEVKKYCNYFVGKDVVEMFECVDKLDCIEKTGEVTDEFPGYTISVIDCFQKGYLS